MFHPPARSPPPFAFAALFGASPTSAACVLQRLVELPVTMDDLRPTVPAKIEGKTVRMLADTGAFFSMISPGAAAAMRLPLHPAPFGLFVTGVGGAMNTSVTTVKDFALDTIPIHHVDFIVGGSETGPGIDGVIGRNPAHRRGHRIRPGQRCDQAPEAGRLLGPGRWPIGQAPRPRRP